MLQETIAIIKELAGNNNLYFDQAIMIKKEPIEISIWGVCVSPDNVLYVMCVDQDWYDAKENRDREIISLVNRRMKELKNRYSKPVHISTPLKEIENQLQQDQTR